MDCRKILNQKKKKVFLTIGEKTRILQEFESGCSIVELCKKYNIDQSVIYKWKRKQGILQMNVQRYGDQRIVRISPNQIINESVFSWFREVKKSDVLPSGPIIKAKALSFYEQIGGSNEFVASTGWLDWWKRNYNIHRFRANSDAAAKRTSLIATAIKEKKLTRKQIFIADETHLYYKILPAKSTDKSLQSVTDVNDRLTLMPCCNADGSLKLPLLVLGKSPLKVTEGFPTVEYVKEKNAWLNQLIVQRWFENEFVPRVKAFLTQQRLPIQAILIVDQAHPYNINQNFITDDIQVMLLPPIMPVAHPYNLGIIESLKKLYRLDFLRTVVNNINKSRETLSDELEKIKIENVMTWLNKAWSNVDSEIIANCWLPLLVTGFSMEGQTVKTENDRSNLTSLLVNMFSQISDEDLVGVEDVENWVNGDQTHLTNTELDEVIVASALEDQSVINQEKQESNENFSVFIKTEEPPDEPMSECCDKNPLELEQDSVPEEVVQALDKVITYCQQKQLASTNEISFLLRLRKKI